MILDYENCIIRGITRAIQHYATANDKYAYNYNESNKSSHIIYLDFNNQNGWALSEPMPCGGIKYA